MSIDKGNTNAMNNLAYILVIPTHIRPPTSVGGLIFYFRDLTYLFFRD